MTIKLVDIYAGYRRGDFILKGVDMEITGDTIMLGPNGSGKTTLMRTLLGISVSKRGKIIIDGVDIDSIKGAPGLLSGNLPELFMLSRLPVKHVAKFYLDLIGGDYNYFEELVTRIGEKGVLGKKFYELSAGLKTIVLDALALASKANYVLLDEPFESLDPARRVAMLNEIVKSKSVKIMSTHTTWLLNSLGDWNVYLMVEGLIYGPLKPRELLDLKVSRKPVGGIVLSIKLRSGGEVYLTKTTGTPISGIDSLDKLYEVLTWQ
ncbi:MAG: ATP-binding cassette domain-containing protein [Desulfurococcaceae archaeon]